MTRTRLTALLVTVVALGCACEVSQAQSSRPKRMSARDLPATARLGPAMSDRGKVTLEIEASPEMLARAADGSFRVRAFQVGYFDGNQLAGAVIVQRDTVQITGNKVRFDAPLTPLPRNGRNPVDVRVRGLSTGPLGAWSSSAGSVSLPVDVHPRLEARNRQRREPGGRAGAPGAADAGAGIPAPAAAGLSVAVLDENPALKAALEPMLGRELSAEDAVARFTKVQDLALAVVIARTHDLSFPALAKAMGNSSSRSLSSALREVDSKLKPQEAVRAARQEARGLVANRRNRR